MFYFIEKFSCFEKKFSYFFIKIITSIMRPLLVLSDKYNKIHLIKKHIITVKFQFKDQLHLILSRGHLEDLFDCLYKRLVYNSYTTTEYRTLSSVGQKYLHKLNVGKIWACVWKRYPSPGHVKIQFRIPSVICSRFQSKLWVLVIVWSYLQGFLICIPNHYEPSIPSRVEIALNKKYNN